MTLEAAWQAWHLRRQLAGISAARLHSSFSSGGVALEVALLLAVLLAFHLLFGGLRREDEANRGWSHAADPSGCGTSLLERIVGAVVSGHRGGGVRK